MKVASAVWLFASLPTVLGDDLTKYLTRLPLCSVQCALRIVPTSPCKTVTNSTCICTNQDLQFSMQACLLRNCTVLQSLEVAKIEAEACGRPERSRRSELLSPIWIEVVAFIFLLLRFYSRWTTIHHFETDDYIMMFCGAIYIQFTIIGQWLALLAFGVDIWTVEPERLTRALKLFYIEESFYIIILCLTKISILSFYLRIFPNPNFRKITYLLMGFFGLSNTLILFLQIFQCLPVKAAWQAWKGDFGPYRCLNVNALAYSAAGISIFQDIIMLALPLPLLYKLNMSPRTKIGIMIMFSLGIFILITSCIRLRYIVTFARSTNPTWDYADPLIWSGLEVSVSMVIASLPAVRVLLNRLIPNILGTVMSRSRGTTGQKGSSLQASTTAKSGSSAVAATESAANLGHAPLGKSWLFSWRRSMRSTSGLENESQLELGDKIKGNVQTEIRTEREREREREGEGEGEGAYGVRGGETSDSSIESGIHVWTTTTIGSKERDQRRRDGSDRISEV